MSTPDISEPIRTYLMRQTGAGQRTVVGDQKYVYLTKKERRTQVIRQSACWTTAASRLKSHRQPWSGRKISRKEKSTVPQVARSGLVLWISQVGTVLPVPIRGWKATGSCEARERHKKEKDLQCDRLRRVGWFFGSCERSYSFSADSW